MTPLRILVVTKSTGGVGEYIRWLAYGLDKTRFQLSVACLSEGGPELARELNQISGVTAQSMAMNRYKIDPFSDGRVAIALARQLRREHYDLVHVHASKPGFLTRMAALGLDVPVLYSPHCFSFHPGAGRLKAQLLAFFERLAARLRTTRIVVVAESEKQLAQSFGVGRPEQFITIPSGVDPLPFQAAVDLPAQRASLGLAEGQFTVGCVGRLSEQKAPLDFIQAAAILARQYPATQFVWIGDGPLLAQARQLCQTLGLTDRFHFAGQRADIPACLAVMDCFLLLSRWEGFPLVVLEAMAAGKPVVASAIAGTTDAIQDGVDGLLVPPANPQAAASGVARILTDPALAHQLAAAGQRKIAERFNRQNMLRGISAAYLSTAKGGPQ